MEVPAAGDGMIHGFDELARRKGDYAIVGLAVQARMGGKGPMKLLRRHDQRLHEVRLGFFGVAETPVLARRAATALEGRPLDAEAIQAARSALADDLHPWATCTPRPRPRPIWPACCSAGYCTH